ncbi:MAG: Gfo/Idh/MocA family oxidoreductase [Candidatus Helarchaeota archaeon]|nr:Gfo/Idh/MocA family oxidoreductase [Candidatus Helarchaeota archaeon]
MEKVKFGLLGGGIAGRFHLAACKKSAKITFISVYDKSETVARSIAKAYQLTPYSNLVEFLKSDIEAVLVAVPHYLHEEMVAAVAKAGKHVLCEKPMATTLEGCDAMIAATRKADVKFMIAENHRFLPAHQWIRDAVQKEWIGEPFLVRSYEGVNEIPGLMQPGFWKGDPIQAGGGCLMDMGVHKFATMQWIMQDQVISAYSWITKQCTTLEEKAEDNAMIFLKFKRGAIAETVVSFTVASPPTNQLEIYGTKGSILENHAWLKPVQINSVHKDMGTNRGIWFEPEIEHGPYPKYYQISARIEDEHFADCILGNKEPEFKPEDAKRAVAVVLMGYLSARLNRTVNYEELMELHRNKGTKSILEGLEKLVQKNYKGGV